MPDFDLGTARGRVELDTSDVDKASASFSRFNSNLGKSLTSTGQKMTSAGRKMTTAVTLPLIGLGFAAVKTSVSFEKTMNTMAAVAGVPGPELQKLRDLAVKLGADTVFSANEAGEAMLELAKAGISTADIMGGALANTLDLATAGDLELAEAATIASNAMNTFHLSGAQAQIAVDALAGAANASSADVSDLAQALSQSGLAARNAGLDVAETTAVLGAFADNGIRGSDAGTSLKTMLLQLVPTTTKAKDAMKELGLQFTTAEGAIKPIGDIFEEIKTKIGPLTQAEQQLALKTIFGTDAFRAASIAMDLGKKGLEDYTKATNEQGTAAKVAQGKMKGLPGVIEKLKGSFETFLLVVGDKLAPIVEEMAINIGELLDKFTALPDPVQENIIKFAALAAIAGPLIYIFGSLFRVVGGGISLLTGLGGATKTAAAGATGASGAFGILAKRLGALGIIVTVAESMHLAYQQFQNYKEGDFAGVIENVASAARLLGFQIPKIFPEAADTASFKTEVLKVAEAVEDGTLTMEQGADAVRKYAEAFNVDVSDSAITAMIENAPDIQRLNALLGAQPNLLSNTEKELLNAYVAQGQYGSALRLVGRALKDQAKGLNNIAGPRKRDSELSGNQAFHERELAKAHREEAKAEKDLLKGLGNLVSSKKREAEASGIAAQKSKIFGQETDSAGDKAKVTQDKVKGLGDEIRRLPERHSTQITAETAGAKADVSSLQNALDAIDKFIQIKIDVIGDRGIGAFSRGTDNFEGGLAIVGEKGPELALLPKHSAIIPNHILRGIMNSRPLSVSEASGSRTVAAEGQGGSKTERMIAMFELDGETLSQSVKMHERENRIKLGGRF